MYGLRHALFFYDAAFGFAALDYAAFDCAQAALGKIYGSGVKFLRERFLIERRNEVWVG